MAIYQVEGREREYEDDPYDPYSPPDSPTSPVVSQGPNYVPPPPTTPPRQGYQWQLYNGQWLEVPQGGFPQTTDQPGMDFERQAPSIDVVPGAGGPTTPTTTGSGYYGGGGSGFGGDFSGSYLPEGWSWPTYAAPQYLETGPFDPGPAFTYKEFAAPRGEDILQDPGFQFRLDQGRKALEASAAGRGVLRSGGTLKDILNYGQNFASQEYGNVFNRALTEYDVNRQNASDIWNKQYGQRKDVFGFRADDLGQRNQFNQRASEFDFSGRQRQAELDFQDAYNRWLAEGNWNRDIVIGGAE